MNAKAEAINDELYTLKDVAFYYSSVTYPNKNLNKENKQPVSDHDLELHSYEIKVALTEERYKKFKKTFKGAHNLRYAKEYTEKEFNEYFNPEEPVRDDMVLVKFAQACLVGKPGSRKPAMPIKQIGIRGGLQDRNGININRETHLGNGTKGHLQIRPIRFDEMYYLYPNALCITELVEYKSKKDEVSDDDAFGLEVLPEAELENSPTVDVCDDDISF